MKNLVLDTETSGMPLWSERSADPRQPHLCEVGAILIDGTVAIEEFHSLVKPNGWTCEEAAREVHGITDEELATGAEELQVVRALGALLARDVAAIIGFSVRFDARMIRIAVARYPDAGITKEQIEAIPVIDLMPTLRKHFGGRSITLGEAYEKAFGRTLDGAHRALGDARATLELYRFALEHGLIESAPAIEAPAAVESEGRARRGGPCDE